MSAATKQETITINFVEDGFTALGKVWYRGEELTVTKGSEDWEKTLTGEKSWMELTEPEQERRWGRRMFREGRWSGAKYDLTDEDLTEEQRAKLAEVNAERFKDVPVVETADTSGRAGTTKRRGPGRPPKKSSTTEE